VSDRREIKDVSELDWNAFMEEFSREFDAFFGAEQLNTTSPDEEK
jgi:hypothetical protein